jgi:hypothetical protein
MPERVIVRDVKIEDARIPNVPIVRSLPQVVSTPPPVVISIIPPSLPTPGFTPPSYVPPTVPIGVDEASTNISPGGVPSGGGGELNIDGVEEYSQSLNLSGIPSIPDYSAEGTKEVIEVLGREIPIPKSDTVILAGTTATASVAAALLGKSLVEALARLMKPVIKQAVARAKKALRLTLTIEETQLYFAFEQKSLRKRLKAEQKADLSRQLLHQHKPRHTESPDEK